MNNKVSQSICPKDDEVVMVTIHMLVNINFYFSQSNLYLLV